VEIPAVPDNPDLLLFPGAAYTFGALPRLICITDTDGKKTLLSLSFVL
jgi:hypothetical protein